MANIDFNSFFSTTSSDNSATNYSWLSEYSSIKSGAYYKIVKAYYAKKSGKTNPDYLEEVDEKQKQNTRTATSAETLKNMTKALTDSSSLFEKREIHYKKEDGSTENVMDYDYDIIYKSIKRFTTAYNDLLDQVENADKTAILSPAAHMATQTAQNANLLSKVGISIAEDNTLAIDEDRMKLANINDLRALFSGNGSYAAQICNKASLIESAARRAADSKNTYTSKGSFDKNTSYSTGNMIDSLT